MKNEFQDTEPKIPYQYTISIQNTQPSLIEENKTVKKITNIGAYSIPIKNSHITLEGKSIAYLTAKANKAYQNIEEFQPQLSDMDYKVIHCKEEYDLSFLAEVEKNIRDYEEGLKNTSPLLYVIHVISKIFSLFQSDSFDTAHTSPDKACINLMTELWHYDLSNDQKDVIEALINSEINEKRGIDENKVGYTYTGTFKNGIIGGIPEGKGIMLYDDSHMYVGYFLNGSLHGHGIWRDPNGSVYSGSFKDGKPNGKGKLVNANGSIYIGEFKDSMIQKGEVAYSKEAGGETFFGIFKDKKRSEGTFFYDTKSQIEEPSAYKFEDPFDRMTQSHFKGTFDEFEQPYNGILTFLNGDKAEYVEGRSIGLGYTGTYTNPDGLVLEYDQGKPKNGILVNPNKEKMEYHESKPFMGILAAEDGTRKRYENGFPFTGTISNKTIDLVLEYKDGYPLKGVYEYPNGETLTYRDGKYLEGTVFLLDGRRVEYQDGELFTGIKTYDSQEQMKFIDGKPFDGILITGEGERIKYTQDKLFTGIDSELEYIKGRPYQGILTYPKSKITLEYLNGRPYHGTLIKANGDQVIYDRGSEGQTIRSKV